jgi:hypothetical protein
MKPHLPLLGICALTCGLGLALPPGAAGVTDDEFNALKELVTKQGQRLDQLEKAHDQDQKTIEQDQKVHQQDQQEILRLEQQMETTQKTATDAQQKAEAAAQIQPIHPIPEGPAASHQFTMVGDAEVQFGKVDSQHSGFALADFAPIFLFRGRDNVLFEAGFDVTLQNGANVTGTHDSGSSTSVSMSFATLDYLFNDYVTFVGGEMLLPLGTYSERNAGWLNKIPLDPLARALVPGSGVGVQLRGAVPVNDSGASVTYAVYADNGPSSIDGSANSTNIDLGGNVGILNTGNHPGTLANLHGDPSGGGRVGWFYPWKAHYDIELGLSGQSGTWDDADRRLWSAGVFDGALHLSPWIEVKGEYLYTWESTSDVGTIQAHGWWLQGAYKLAGLNLDLPLINDIELVGRYDDIRDGMGGHADRYTAGYVYYLSNTLLFEGDYFFGSGNLEGPNHNELLFQLSYGF